MGIVFEKGLKRVFRKTAQRTGLGALQFYIGSYSKEGKTDKSFVPWAKRKDKKNKKPILVDTRMMKKSFHLRTKSSSFVIENRAPYAIYHNEGIGQIKREILYESEKLNKEIEKELVKEVEFLMSKMFK